MPRYVWRCNSMYVSYPCCHVCIYTKYLCILPGTSSASFVSDGPCLAVLLAVWLGVGLVVPSLYLLLVSWCGARHLVGGPFLSLLYVLSGMMSVLLLACRCREGVEVKAFTSSCLGTIIGFGVRCLDFSSI